MNKRFFLAALSAVALTMGFTACDDDNVDAGKYEMNVFLRLDQVSSDEDESKQIFETYITALGITDQEEMTVTIQGKDSLDCVNTVTEKCAKAEAQLNGQQWSSLTAISVSIPAEKNSTLLYSKTFGTSSSNGKKFTIKQFGPEVSNRGGHSAKDMLVQCQNSPSGSSDWKYEHPYYNPIELNWDARGKYVYTMFDNSGVTSFKDLRTYVINNDTDSLNQYIADVLILVSDSYHGDFHEFTYNGATYKYAHGIYNDPVMWDMNMGASGPYLHLFYSTDAMHFQRVIDIDMSLIAFCEDSFWVSFKYHNFTLDDIGRGNWRYSEFVKAVRYNNGNVVFERADGDFNQGAGGAFLHMRADYISFDELRNNEFDENGNAIKD